MPPAKPSRCERDEGPPVAVHPPQPPTSQGHNKAAASAWRRARLGLIHWMLPDYNPAGAVFGTLTAGALLAAESGLRDTYPETVGSVLLVVVLYWLAHSYADLLGLRLSSPGRLTLGRLWHAFGRDWAIVRGAFAPVLALLVAWALGAPQATAVSAGTWTAVVSLVAFELAAGLRSRAKAPELALQVGVGAAMGLGILALRAMLH
jgi:hypothetical protein